MLCETEGSSVCLVALRASGHWGDYWIAMAGAWENSMCNSRVITVGLEGLAAVPSRLHGDN